MHVRTCRYTPTATIAWALQLMHALQLSETQLHAKFHHNRASRYRVAAGEALVTPLRRHAPGAPIGTDMIRHWSHTRQEGWDYPSKKTACQSGLRFQRYKPLKSVTMAGRTMKFWASNVGSIETAHSPYM